MKLINTCAVSEKAMLARIRRHYAKEACIVRQSRSPDEQRTCGRWFVVNANNHVFWGFDDIEVEARRIGVVAQWEVAAAG